jgi:DNA-binding transcriptional regulator YhcF (GntR family)
MGAGERVVVLDLAVGASHDPIDVTAAVVPDRARRPDRPPCPRREIHADGVGVSPDLENPACDRPLALHDVEAGRSVDGCCATATTGQFEPRQDPAPDEQCEQSDRKGQVPAASAPARVGNQRGEARTRRWERRLRHQEKLLLLVQVFHVKLNRNEPTDLHEQVAAEIRRAIAKGEASPGERLPSAMDLASVLKVNRNTVLRALRQLRDEGLLEVRRGRGITVVATPEQGELHARVRELVEFARRHGCRRDELVDLIRAV